MPESDAGDAEVEQLERPVHLVDHDVGRLDVAVDDARLVRVGEAVAQLLGELQLADDAQRHAGADHLGERVPLDVLHGDEGLLVVNTDVEDHHDVRVSKAGDGSRFAGEPLAQIVVVLAQQLDGDLALERRIPREVEGAHPAPADSADDFEAADKRRNRSQISMLRAKCYHSPIGVLGRIPNDQRGDVVAGRPRQRRGDQLFSHGQRIAIARQNRRDFGIGNRGVQPVAAQEQHLTVLVEDPFIDFQLERLSGSHDVGQDAAHRMVAQGGRIDFRLVREELRDP